MKRKLSFAISATALLLAQSGHAADDLAASFRAPPDSAKPRVWWHWLDGNVSEEGVRLDLDWMKRAGIGGFQNFNASLFLKPVVGQPVEFGTPAWRKATKLAAETADHLGLEMGVSSAPGWTESGGPWVSVPDSMKKLVWSSTVIEGGKPFAGKLAAPPANAGPYQDLQRPAWSITGSVLPVEDFYRDSAVVAYRLPDGALLPSDLSPKVSSNAGPVDLAKPVRLPYPAEGDAFLLLDYGQPRAIDALTLALVDPYPLPAGIFPPPAKLALLESSADGKSFTPVADVPGSGLPVHTLAFAPVTARYFRLRLLARTKPDLPPIFPALAASSEHEIGSFVLHALPRVHHAEEKAGFDVVAGLDAQATPPSSARAPVKADVVDLSGKMGADGTLDWTPPAGKWVVLRMGWSPLGTENHPATEAATGLEVDKLSREHVHHYVEAYLGQYRQAAGDKLIGKHGVSNMVFDSWEVGAQNWTEDMPAEFARRRGYDLHPWLPVLTGQVIDSAEASDRFLWDYRKTIGEMIADNHYGEAARTLHAQGLIEYAESHEVGRAMIADGMDVKRQVDVPMSAMWTPPRDPVSSEADIREAASVAHLTGKTLVAAESMTSMAAPYSFSPESLKPVADLELASGVNRFFIHSSVHQPLAKMAPGLTLGPFGIWFNRNDSWAEMASGWTRYLARSSHLLQQGRNVADVLWFYGEDSNITAEYGTKLPPVPEGYEYDFVSADMLTDLVSAKEGALVTPAGASYKVLALAPRNRLMTVSVLRKLAELVKGGAVIVGDRPQGSPSEADDPKTVTALIEEIWGSGKVRPAAELAKALTAPADFAGGAGKVAFVHRQLADGDLYFLLNRTDQPVSFDGTFRVAGRAAEIWRAEDGSVAPASYRGEAGRTVVPLKLAAHDALFVLFRGGKARPERQVKQPDLTAAATLQGPWKVAFQAGRGAPAETTLAQLGSLSEQSDPGIRYFSGVATYRIHLTAPAGKGKLWLDLGEVKNVAEIKINGRDAGIVWHPPFRLEISAQVKPGDNELDVAVADLWQNRLIGDHQPGARPVADTSFNPYPPNTPLPKSGLIGPVTLQREAPGH